MAITKALGELSLGRGKQLLAEWAAGKAGNALSLRFSLFFDQIIFSASNFLLTISITRAYSNRALAAYGVALSLALGIQTAQRSVYIVPFALLSTRTAQKLVSGRVGEHLIVLVVLIPLLIATTATFSSDTLVISLFTGLLYFGLEFERMALIKCGHIWAPVISSSAYLVGVGLFALSARYVSFTAAATLLCVFCVIKSAIILFSVARPHWIRGYRMLKRDLKIYAPWAIIGALLYSGYNQIPFLILAATREPAEAAAFIAIRALSQPLLIVIRSLDIVDKHSLKDESAGTAEGLRAVFWRTFVSYSWIGLATLLIITFAREPILHLAYGEKFLSYSWLLPLWGVATMIMAVAMPVQSIVTLNRSFKRANLWQLFSALLALGATLALCPLWGAYGVTLATLLGALFTLVGFMYEVREIILPTNSRKRQQPGAFPSATACQSSREGECP